MSRTDNLKRQHQEIVKVVTEISGYLTPDKAKADANKVHSLLSSLAGKLKLHLGAEDKILYPELLKHNDVKVQSVTKKFMAEMGTIGASFETYLSKWKTPNDIQNNPVGFVADTKGLFDVLGKRVHKEESELYPLAG